MTISVGLADAHAGLRSAIRCLLERSSEIVVVGEADNGKAALQMAKELTPDVLVLDAEMPQMTGLEVSQQLAVDKSPVRILLLSVYANFYKNHPAVSQSCIVCVEKKDMSTRLLTIVHQLAQAEPVS